MTRPTEKQILEAIRTALAKAGDSEREYVVRVDSINGRGMVYARTKDGGTEYEYAIHVLKL